MLSRFSKLPGISSLLPNNSYPPECIDNAVAEIKKLGRHSPNSEDTLQGITKILNLMKKYCDSLHVQRVACHALSNLAMQVVVARWIVQKGGFNLIKKSICKFENDSKLCWLASSAVWNLARPPANRGIIGAEGVKLMLRILKIHHQKEKVTNTTIGALSNLSLADNLKDLIADSNSVELILKVLQSYVQRKSLCVMTSGAGLIANLAVSDNHATLLVKKNCLPILLDLLKWNIDTTNDTLYRNDCAALNNMVTAKSFLDSFLRSQGVETIFKFLKTNDNDLYSNLLENVLINIEVETSTPTTSVHLSALHGKLEILQELIRKHPFHDLNATDSKNMTCLDYALSMQHLEVVEFLTKCGATKYEPKILNDIHKNDNNKNTGNNNTSSQEMEQAIHRGFQILNNAHMCNRNAIYSTVHSFPEDVCKLIVGFNSNIDMLDGMKQFC